MFASGDCVWVSRTGRVKGALLLQLQQITFCRRFEKNGLSREGVMSKSDWNGTKGKGRRNFPI